MKPSTWQVAVVVGVVLAMTVLSFINAGVFAFIATLIAWLAGAGLGALVGAEGGRRDSAAQIRLLEQSYAGALEAANDAVVAQAQMAHRLAGVEEDLRQANADRAQLRAQFEQEAAQPEAVES